MKNEEIKFIVIDLFCGAGGVTTGFEQSEVAKVIACVNHDKQAIESHLKNHPETEHFEEDILNLNMTLLIKCVKRARLKYKNARLILWASLECTNFSIAKGGLPRDADSRTLACGLYRYIWALKPDYIQIENVREFRDWGPIDKNGIPIKEKKGIDFIRWKNIINQRYGYYDEHKILDSADFGANTSRKRLFMCFAKPNLEISFPKQTHVKREKGQMFSDLKPWNPVKPCLDLNNQGKSIFNRKKDLSDNTLNRILQGVEKHDKSVDNSFVLKYNSMNKNGVCVAPSIHEPSPTIAAQDRLGLTFIQKYYSGENKTQSIDVPCGTLTTIDHHSVVNVINYHGNSKGLINIDKPSPTITASDTLGLVFIYNPSWGSQTHTINKPCPVIIARQDKAPLSLITCEKGNFSIPIYENDSDVMIKLKKEMVKRGIVDIKMRMFTTLEKLKIQGFPEDYVLVGSEETKGKHIGNSVTPVIPRQWAMEMSKLF